MTTRVFSSAPDELCASAHDLEVTSAARTTGALLLRLRAIQSRGDHQGETLHSEAEVDYADLPSPIPDGLYEARFLHHETAYVFRAPKVFLWFEIVQPGAYCGIRLYRAYRARALIGKPSRSGRFRVRRGSELYWMLYRILELKLRPDRISPTRLKQYVLEIRVRTVVKDYKQRDLPEALRYSVVEDVIRKLTG